MESQAPYNGSLGRSRFKRTASFLWEHAQGGLICAAMLILFDAVISGSFELSFFFIPIWLLVAIIQSIFWRKGWRVAMARITLPLATLVVVFGNAALQVKLARWHAQEIITACQRYKSDTGTYPEKLSDLTPKYLDWVPPAKYCLFLGTFWYDDYKGSQSLMWVELPPFGRPGYDFEKAKWWYLD